MQLKTIKTTADLPFKGIELVKVDNAITEVIIGGKLRIRKGESYSNALLVLTDAPGEFAKRYKVTAELDGFAPTVEFFEDSYSADARKQHFEGLGAKVEKTHTDVLIAETGDIVEAAPEVASELEDLPF